MNRDRVDSIIILIALALIWGSSFILIKKGLLFYEPAQVGSLRIVISAFIFLPYALKNINKYSLKLISVIALFAILEIGLPPFLYAYAQTVVNSSTAGILNSLVPLFTLLTGFVIFKVSTNWLKVSGVLTGLFGAVLLIFFKAGDFTTIDIANSWGLLIVLATLFYGLGGNILKEYLQDIPDAQITAIAFFTMGVPASIYLFSTDFVSVTINRPEVLPSFFAIAALSIFGSALAILLFSKMVRKSSALFASFVTYLIPFVALLWGFVDGEGITFMQLLCMLLILAGIYIANQGMKKEISK